MASNSLKNLFTKIAWRSGIWAPAYKYLSPWILFPRRKCYDARLISISGCGHGGTTLLATILGSHSRTKLIPVETEWFLGLGPQAWIKEIKFRNYLSKSGVKKSNLTLIEKTPRHVFRIPYIENLYSNSKFLVMIRDPRDLVSSISKRIGDFEGALKRVELDFKAINKIKSNPKVKIIRYEDLVTDFESTLNKILEFTDLRFERSLLDFSNQAPDWFNTEKSTKTNGFGKENHILNRAWQVKQPLFDGRGRYKKDLSTEQLNLITGKLSSLIQDFYPDIQN